MALVTDQKLAGNVVTLDSAVSKDIPRVFVDQPSWEKDGRKCPNCGSEDTYFWHLPRSEPNKPHRIIVGVFWDDVCFEIFKCRGCNKGFVESLEIDNVGNIKE